MSGELADGVLVHLPADDSPSLRRHTMAHSFSNELSVVVSNDSDLVEPIRMVTQELRRPLGLIEPKNQRRVRSDALVRVGRPAFVKGITPADLAASQLPDEVSVGRRNLHRPSDW